MGNNWNHSPACSLKGLRYQAFSMKEALIIIFTNTSEWINRDFQVSLKLVIHFSLLPSPTLQIISVFLEQQFRNDREN